MNRRGQLVLVASVLVALAIVSLVFAFMQLGYNADVRAGGAYDDPSEDALSVLPRVVHEASADVPAQFRWSRRSDAVRAVEARLDSSLVTIETARIREGIYRNLTYNSTLATRWAATHCPSGPNRQFGACVAIGGVVVQNRLGATHVLAVAFDLRTTTERGWTELSTVVRTVGDEWA